MSQAMGQIWEAAAELWEAAAELWEGRIAMNSLENLVLDCSESPRF